MLKMYKKQICLLLFLHNIQTMELEEHHKKIKPRSGSNEFVTINILPQKDSSEIKLEEADKKEERKTQLKVAAIAAVSAIVGAGLTAAVTLTIHFTECNQE